MGSDVSQKCWLQQKGVGESPPPFSGGKKQLGSGNRK